MWGVQADCIEYTANWDKDDKGWFKVKDPSMYLRPGENSMKYNSTKEANALLFFPHTSVINARSCRVLVSYY